MNLNHLKNGLVSTYEYIIFLRRVGSQEREIPVLEVSKPIPKDKLIQVLAFFCNLTLPENFLLTTPNTPSETQNLKNAKFKNVYDPVTNVPLSSFQFSKPIASGTFGCTMKGYSAISRKHAVYKVADSLKQKESFGRFMNEVSIYQKAESLQGAIIPILYATYIASGFVLILEMSDGGSPLESISNSSSIETYREAILVGYESLNDKGILHCDVALRNMLVDNGEIKIIDFGLSKIRDMMEAEEWEECLKEENDNIESLFHADD